MKQVMLVDDSPLLLSSMSDVLKRNEIDVLTAESGQKALDILEDATPDLVITDLNMPGMDGIDLIRKIKSLSSMRFKPILMLTTESKLDKREEAKQAGAMGWLVKPVKPAELMDVVGQVLPS